MDMFWVVILLVAIEPFIDTRKGQMAKVNAYSIELVTKVLPYLKERMKAYTFQDN